MLRTADYWVRTLKMVPHPEGGHYVETYRSPVLLSRPGLPSQAESGAGNPHPTAATRSCATAIYFLLRGDEFSAFHRLRSDEMWHFHAGSAATIVMIAKDGTLTEARIGPDPDRGEAFQLLVPAETWFGATVEDADSYTLVGCTVSPGFAFEDFELGRREALLAAYPAHRAVIERLTRA